MLSVIIPCYNQGRFIKDAVTSVIDQCDEVIVVNDGSADDTKDFCTDLLKLSEKIAVIHLDKNSGKPVAINTAVANSSGEYITILDADDMREPDSLEKMLEAIRKDEHSFVYDDMIIYVNGAKGKVWKFPEYNFDALLESNTIHTGIMFTRSAFDATGGYPEDFTDGREDWAFNILLGMKGFCGVHVNNPGYLYRRGAQNRTLRNTTPEWKEHFKQKIRTKFADLYLGRFPMGCCGGRRSYATRLEAVPLAIEKLVGSEGMTAVEYLGGNFGTQTYYGFATGAGYKFDANRRIKMVDNRDLHSDRGTGILDLREHTRSLFKIASEQPESVKVTEPVVIPEEESVGTPIESKVNSTNKNLQKLKDAGFDYIEQVLAVSAEEISSKSGIAENTIRKLQEMLKK